MQSEVLEMQVMKANDKPRIAILEDESAICALLHRILDADFAVRVFDSGTELLNAIQHDELDLVLLDILLPGENGISIAKAIRARSKVPIVLLSGLSATETIVTGLNIGADDYVTKPFQPEILKARIRKALAQNPVRQRASPAKASISFVGGQIDPWNRTIGNDAGESIAVTEMEVNLLSLLCRNAPTIVTRDELSRGVAGHNRNPDDRALDVHISHIRSKLQKLGCPRNLIVCHRGRGYSFRGEIIKS
jgi:two-component system OmpR family response regulator